MAAGAVSERAWHAIETESGEVWIDPCADRLLQTLQDIAASPATSYLVCGEGPCFGRHPDEFAEAVLIGCALAFPQHRYVIVGNPRRLHARLYRLTAREIATRLQVHSAGEMLAGLVRAAVGEDRLGDRVLPHPGIVIGARVEDQEAASHDLPWLLDIPCARHLVVIPSTAAHPIELSDLRPLDVPQNGDIDALTGAVYYVGSMPYRDSISAWKGKTGKVDWLVFEDTQDLTYHADDLALRAEMLGARVDYSNGAPI